MTQISINKSTVFTNAHAAHKLLSNVMDFSECLFAEWMFAKMELKKYRKGSIVNSLYLITKTI